MTIDLDAVREAGAAAAARQAVDWLGGGGTAGYWVHLDVDVLDDAVLPTVDYRLPGGLSWAELETVLRVALSSGQAVGLDGTIFNPRLDPDGRVAVRLAECLRRGVRADRRRLTMPDGRRRSVRTDRWPPGPTGSRPALRATRTSGCPTSLRLGRSRSRCDR